MVELEMVPPQHGKEEEIRSSNGLGRRMGEYFFFSRKITLHEMKKGMRVCLEGSLGIKNEKGEWK